MARGQTEAKFVNQLRINQGIKSPKTGRDRYRVKHQPGLYLFVHASGHMAWSAMYRVSGQLVKQTHPMAPVEEAVRWARDFQDQAKQGTNPVADRRVAAERAAANTVAGAVDAWLAQCERDLKPKTVQGYRQLFDHDIIPRWTDRPLASITKADVLELINDKANNRERKRRGATGGAAVQANRLLTRLRTFFGWAAANDLVTADPTAGVRKPAKEVSRARVLSDDEIRAFWVATDALDANRRDAVAVGPLFRMLLLTAQRESEVAGMRWSEIDLDKREWTIPAARAKNAKEHVVHLSEFAIEVLTAAKQRQADAHSDKRNRRDAATLPTKLDLVFSGTGKMPAIGFARAKSRLDKSMAEALSDDREPFVLHDLRRTATSCMARLGVEPHVADRVLNHTAGTIRGVAAVYNRHQYIDDRRLAVEVLGKFVGMLVRDRLPAHVAEGRVKVWLRQERERSERDAAGENVVEFEPKAAATA